MMNSHPQTKDFNLTDGFRRLRGEVDLLSHPDYDPDNLLDNLMSRLSVNSDYALSKKLEITPVTISKLRNRRGVVTASILLRMHDVSGLPVNLLRKWMGVEPYMADQNHIESSEQTSIERMDS